MEKIRKIKKADFTKGYLIELECCMCGREDHLAASTKKELSALLKYSGWRELDSDEYALIGYYCGCDYKD